MIKNFNTELVLCDCFAGRISKKQAVAELQISRRTLDRKLNKLAELGTIEHGLCRRPSNNRPNPIKDKIISIVRDKYFDCGPTLASEFLSDHDGIVVHPETLRRWMHKAGIMNKTRKRKPYRSRRARKPCFNDMLQIDGSFHEWFGRFETCMMNLIDDATNVNMFCFAMEETIESACLLLWGWCKRYGVPKSIYSDCRNMYSSENENMNFFTMMCQRLGIRLIKAYSPQAKGRIERCNRTHQERLIPWLRLKGISNIEQANGVIGEYIARHNGKFNAVPLSEARDYKKLMSGSELEEYCYIENPRKVSNDWVVSYGGKKYQLRPQSLYCPAKSTVLVREYLDSKISIFYRSNKIPFETL